MVTSFLIFLLPMNKSLQLSILQPLILSIIQLRSSQINSIICILKLGFYRSLLHENFFKDHIKQKPKRSQCLLTGMASNLLHQPQSYLKSSSLLTFLYKGKTTDSHSCLIFKRRENLREVERPKI